MIVITGASGFLGTEILSRLKNECSTLSIGRRVVSGTNTHIYCDLSIEEPTLPKNCKRVIHLAGKAHTIPKTPSEVESFYLVNLQGTINLLAALDRLQRKPEQFIFASTVAVYGVDVGEEIAETNKPRPSTPYGKSKLAAEKKIEDWCKKNDINYLILRLPLLVGANPPGNLGKIKLAIQKGRYPRILGNSAKKSMVLTQDIADLVLNFQTGQGIYNLTDGVHPSFNAIEEAIEKRVNNKIKVSIPLSFLKIAATIGDKLEKLLNRSFPISTSRLIKLTGTLTFSDRKARQELGWQPQPVLLYIEKYL